MWRAGLPPLPVLAEPVEEQAWAALYRVQGGLCAGCLSSERELFPQGIWRKHAIWIDHDHETMLIRGLLCRGCNMMEGRRDLVDAGPLFAAYRANPPAAGAGWLWDDICFPWQRKASAPPRPSIEEQVRDAVAAVAKTHAAVQALRPQPTPPGRSWSTDELLQEWAGGG